MKQDSVAESNWTNPVSDLNKRICPRQAGDPAFQAKWKLYVVLISITVWQDRPAGAQVACMEIDSKATVRTCAKVSPNKQTRISVAAKINLRVVEQVKLGHTAGVANCEADALPQLCQSKSVPSHLAGSEMPTPSRVAANLRAWSPVFAEA